MSHILKYLLLSTFLILSKSEIKYSSCIDNKRNITLEDGTIKSFDCIECDIDKYTIYNEDKLICIDCPEKSHNYGHNIIIDTFTDKVLSRYSPIFEVNCDNNDKKYCPKWGNGAFSLKVENANDHISSKSILKWKQYYVKDGEFIIKYINYNGDINKYLLIYINNVLVYKDDTQTSSIKTKQFSIKKGQNEINIEYIIDKNLEPKNKNDIESFLEIYEIQMINAETSSLECQKYDNINELKNSILNNCEYDVSKCNEEDFCTYRFFNQQSKGNNIKNATQEIYYNKIKGATCKELIIPESKEIDAEVCSYGQYLKLKENSEIIYSCELCSNNFYNDKLINLDTKCSSVCDTTTKDISKILYISSFSDPSQYIIEEIEIVKTIGYIEVNYEKFNLREDVSIFVEITEKEKNTVKTYQLINPDKNKEIADGNFNFLLPLKEGKYSVQIKGKNLKMKEIKIINNAKGGNYKCTDKLSIIPENTCPDGEYYSSNIKSCTHCPDSLNYIENSNCAFSEVIINNNFKLDNSELFKGKLFHTQNKISQENNVEYYLFLNPNYPLIYEITQNQNSKTIEIIGDEFKRMKIIKGNKNRGIIISYLHNDYNDENKNYTTNIYINCNKAISDSQETLKLLKNITNEDMNYYYFYVESSSVCPICLKSEVTEDKSGQCPNDEYELYTAKSKDDAECVIKPFKSESSLELNIPDNSNLILYHDSALEEDIDLIQNYQITENIPVIYGNEDDDIVTEKYRYNYCSKDVKDESLAGGYIALIVIACLLVIAVIGFIVWKYVLNHKMNDTEISKDYVKEMNLKNSDSE